MRFDDSSCVFYVFLWEKRRLDEWMKCEWMKCTFENFEAWTAATMLEQPMTKPFKLANGIDSMEFD